MAEWSNALDLKSSSFGSACSNQARVDFFISFSTTAVCFFCFTRLLVSIHGIALHIPRAALLFGRQPAVGDVVSLRGHDGDLWPPPSRRANLAYCPSSAQRRRLSVIWSGVWQACGHTANRQRIPRALRPSQMVSEVFRPFGVSSLGVSNSWLKSCDDCCLEGESVIRAGN